ncbi:MAG: AAA family ATPase [Candidatus Zambryskibacteria bacterium]|nr:AAA family ATPase [Candidatus Zambryskibacteria bacterium]
MIDKQKLISDLKNKIEEVREKVNLEQTKIKELGKKEPAQVRRMPIEDQYVYFNLLGQKEIRLRELEDLSSSPFFVKCEVVYEKNKEKKIIYFSKHQLIEEGISSWVAPVSSIRFETPGSTSYIPVPGGEYQSIKLLSKDQYMIVDGKIVFFSTEGVDVPRELVYQEHFSARKSGFVLPEIVAMMEKAQDAVIRSYHKGQLVVSGPAGSGKTTLALHRVAYLLQSPEVSHIYEQRSVIVFVQDSHTKDYFGHLLPDLGITHVTITTFVDWARKILEIPESVKCSEYSDSLITVEMSIYQHDKLKILSILEAVLWKKDFFSMLDSVYEKNLPKESYALFLKQKKQKILDRVDITILLRLYKFHNTIFTVSRTFTTVNKKGDFKEKTQVLPLEYSMIVVDEFQNYLPAELLCLKESVRVDTQAILYVGDIAQQVRIGSISNWSDIDENISVERIIKLEKVYRNTKAILEYIRALGYTVNIPLQIKEGKNITEYVSTDPREQIAFIENIVDTHPGKSIGIIGKSREDIKDHVRLKKNKKADIRVYTMYESQGVEFDIVCIVGIKEDMFTFTKDSGMSDDLLVQLKKVYKDLFYVALTRAMEELYIVGSCEAKEAVRSLVG